MMIDDTYWGWLYELRKNKKKKENITGLKSNKLKTILHRRIKMYALKSKLAKI